MILISGCSFSTDTGLDEGQENLIWPVLVANRLGLKYKNFSEPGKSNSLIIRNLYTYLIWVKAGRFRKPSHILLQLTDSFRDHMVKHTHSGEFKPNNIDSQISLAHWEKKISWNGYLAKKASGENGMGSKLQIIAPSGTKKSTQNSEEIKIALEHYTYDIGDESLREPQLRLLIEIDSLQRLCKEMKIPLSIINFWGFDHHLNPDPLYNNIDRSDFLINNMHYGLYDHLVEHSFRETDGFHFNIDGHKYISDLVCNFIKTRKQIKVYEPTYRKVRPLRLMDYTV